MNFLSNVVIILVFISCHTNCLPITKYFIEDFCQEFSHLSPNYSNPLTLYLTRKKPIIFEDNYCVITLNTSDNFFLEMEGHLGQLTVDKSRSDDRSIHLLFNSNITKNEDIFLKFLSKKVVMIIENNEININNKTNTNLMNTELEFRAVFKQENYDCDESNEPCQNTEEEMEESSGGLPPSYECPDNDCSGESYSDCDDYETNCTSNESSQKQKRNELHLDINSGSDNLGANHLAVILCSLFWFRFT